MSVGKLKALCLELKVMSAAFIEKADFQKALAPFAAPAPKAAPAPVPAPAPAAKPAAKRSFTRSQLDTMSAKELRLLCRALGGAGKPAGWPGCRAGWHPADLPSRPPANLAACRPACLAGWLPACSPACQAWPGLAWLG